MTGFVRTQVGIERDAVRLVNRPDVLDAVTALAERWRAATPGFLPETYAQLRPSIDEVVFLVALQVVNGGPCRPQVVEISAGPTPGAGSTFPGVAGASTTPTRCTSRCRSSAGRGTS